LEISRDLAGVIAELLAKEVLAVGLLARKVNAGINAASTRETIFLTFLRASPKRLE